MPRTRCENCGGGLPSGAVECPFCHSAVPLDPAPPTASRAPSGQESASSSAPPPLPAGWIRTVDSWAGYSVGHPPQWKAKWRSGVITVSKDATGTTQAFVWPIQLQKPLHAQQLAERYFERAKLENSEFEAWLNPPLEAFPPLVILRTRSRVSGRIVEGYVSVAVSGSNALIRGFHGVPEKQGSGCSEHDTQVLMTITGTFQLELPARRRSFHEPKEGSFDAMLPIEWEGSGRTRRWNLSGLTTCEYLAKKDGLTQVVVPGKLWQYADGALVGMLLLGAMGTRKFSAARDFGPELVTREFKKQAQLRVEGATEAPEYFGRLFGDLATIGLDPRTAEISTACVASQHVQNGVRVRQKSFIGTGRAAGMAKWMSEFSGQWLAFLLAHYQAPVSEFERIEPVLAGVAESFQINRAWIQQERLMAMQMAMILGQMLQQQNQMTQQQHTMSGSDHLRDAREHLTHTLHGTTDTILATGQHHDAVMNHVFQGIHNTTMGVTQVVDPPYGNVLSVDSSFPYHWRSDSGTFMDTMSSVSPGSNWQPMVPVEY